MSVFLHNDNVYDKSQIQCVRDKANSHDKANNSIL